MKKTLLSLFTSLCLVAFILPCPASAEFKKTKIAVLDFQLQGEGFETADMGKIVAEWLITALVKEGRFDVIERRLLAKVMEEQKFGVSGLADESTVAKLGKILGAKIVITGSVMRFQNVMEVNARIIEVESTSIIAAESVKSTSAVKLEDLVVKMAEKIIKDFPLEGYIIQRNENNILIDLGKRAGVKAGTQFMVYKEGKVIKHPKTGEVLDVEKIETGTIEIRDVKDKTSDAIIVRETSPNSIKQMQLVKSAVELVPEMTYAKPETPDVKTFTTGEQDEFYRKAVLLKDEGDYDSACAIFKKLASETPGNSTYQIAHIDALLDQAAAMKEANNPGWAGKLKETTVAIKSLRGAGAANAYYYLVFAKYSWIAESRKESNITKSLDKAFYLRPNYPYANIVKGDIYFGLAKSTSSLEQQADTTSLTGGSPVYLKHTHAMTAKSAYASALSSPDLDTGKKCYTYYKLGELEYQLLDNKEEAKSNWEKAASLAPDSRIGKLAKERLLKLK